MNDAKPCPHIVRGTQVAAAEGTLSHPLSDGRAFGDSIADLSQGPAANAPGVC